MIRTLKRKFSSAQSDSTVQVPVPVIDHDRTDPRNLLVIVVGIEDFDFYKFANKNDTLKQLFTQNQRFVKKSYLPLIKFHRKNS